MSSIAILGSGRVGKALAAGLTAAGHDVVIGSRTPEDTTAAWEGPAVNVTSIPEALANAEIVINATPGDSAVDRLSALREQLAGKVLMDVSNATVRGADGAPGGLVYPNGSLAEQLQEALPQTEVVKTLNTMLFMVMVAPHILKNPPTAFLSGDSADAKARVASLLADLGWTDDQIVDLGGIGSARGPEAVMLLVPDVMRTRGFVPFAIGLFS
jgi:8-hydroxy-5-deazaflavin:NADPH oxidoreductase